MEPITLFLTALGLSMDAFAVSVSNGLCFKNFKKNQAFLSSLAFGLFQGLMPTMGFFAGNLFLSTISKFDHWLALILLGYIGINMIVDALKEAKSDKALKLGKDYTLKTLLLQAVATSIDALAVGISFAALKINILLAASTICIVTFICCIIGSVLGKKFGHLLQEKAKVFGGVILVFIGLKIFIEHTFLT